MISGVFTGSDMPTIVESTTTSNILVILTSCRSGQQICGEKQIQFLC